MPPSHRASVLCLAIGAVVWRCLLFPAETDLSRCALLPGSPSHRACQVRYFESSSSVCQCLTQHENYAEAGQCYLAIAHLCRDKRLTFGYHV